MIITKTPFRISFFGGGTDYPAWLKENNGSVIGTTINKYCYISCRVLPPFFEHKHRIVYSIVENVKTVSEIQHPSVRAALEYMGIDDGIEIHHDGDLPAKTGLGSSSSFTVGLLHALYAMKGVMLSKKQLASEAIHIEKNILKENVGLQDQILVSTGGFKKIEFASESVFQETPIIVHDGRLNELKSHLMLFFTGISRFASSIAGKKIENIPKKKYELALMREMVEEAISIITSGKNICEFGKLLNESWKLKRTLTDNITNSFIDNIYDNAMETGAIGGKILGAGGGGFMLLFAKPQDQTRIKKQHKSTTASPQYFSSNCSSFHGVVIDIVNKRVGYVVG
jgi:D-glycero-alpha-D-manno-heptose-7-phosphate kinase